MKHKFCIYSLICLILTAMPFIPATMAASQTESQQHSDTATDMTTEHAADASDTPQESAARADTDGQSYHVLDIATQQILEISVREYLIGAVGAEMPVSFAPEALKAQAVAAHTYAERQVLLAENRSDLQGADFSNDPEQYQAFYTKTQLQACYAENFDACYQKISEAVDAVLPEILCYENEPIIAAFHAMSSGKTESAQNVWGSDIIYLQSVDSSSDMAASDYEQRVSFSAQQVQTLLTTARSSLLLGTDTANWFGEPTCSAAGTVLQIPVGTSIFTGQELREIFSLRSACFTVSYQKQEKSFTFTTRGYGHSVGMSQYGANAMALQGADYREILAYYYPHTTLKTV